MSSISERRRVVMKDLMFSMENRPGTLADLGESLSKAGINIDSNSGTQYGYSRLRVQVILRQPVS